jgi:hypothetical protein
MTSSLDLILLPLVRHGGRDYPELFGLYTATPPRRAARGRSADQLVIHYSQEGNAPLTSKALNKLLDHLSATYYKTSGSATSAMRAIAETFNQYLLERNLRGASRALQSVGILTLLVLRGSRLLLAQCGPTHGFLVKSDGVQHLHDPQVAGRGLGLSRATNLNYHQADLEHGDYFLISTTPPPEWTTTALREYRAMELEHLHQRLLHRVGAEFEAVCIRAQAGTGRLRLLRPEPIRAELKTTPQRVQSPQEIVAEPEKQAERPEEMAVIEAPPKPPPQVETPKVEQAPSIAVSPVHAPAAEQPAEPATKSVPVPKKKRKPSPIGPMLATVARAVTRTFQQAAEGVGALFKRMLPDESLFTLPPSAMAFIAIAVPLIIVTVASVVYVQRGRGQLYEEYYTQAQFAAEQAAQMETPNDQRIAWQATLGYLDQAEGYLVTEESQALREYARAILDEMDTVERLNFQPAIVGGLVNSINVTRLVSTLDNELYLLDSTEGKVLRAEFTEGGFVLDQGFLCGPIPQPLIVGPLLDLVALPLGNPNQATVMGMDGNGNLLQCMPGGKPPLAFQTGPPDTNWGTPQAFALDNTDLYIFDPQTNAVWIDWGRDEYRERPSFFFGEQVPTLSDVVDLTISGDDLFLLHDDSHLTTCTYSYLRESPTRCTDPATFTDLRIGRESGATIADATFSEIQFAPPPDPSIYILDPIAQSIYHFSMRLVLQRQYRSQTSLPPEPATAFTVGPNRLVFLAIGNKVYYAALP